jgi:hypothetical protein
MTTRRMSRREAQPMERDTGFQLSLGLGVLVVMVFGVVGRALTSLRNTRVLTRIRVDGWARRHGW